MPRGLCPRSCGRGLVSGAADPITLLGGDGRGVVGSASSALGGCGCPARSCLGNRYEWEVTLFLTLYPDLRLLSLCFRFSRAAALPRRAGAGARDVESWRLKWP